MHKHSQLLAPFNSSEEHSFPKLKGALPTVVFCLISLSVGRVIANEVIANESLLTPRRCFFNIVPSYAVALVFILNYKLQRTRTFIAELLLK